MRNPLAKRPTALVLALSLIGYMIALIGPALAVGVANAANGKVVKSWNQLGTVITEDINLSDSALPADAAGRILTVGDNVTVTGADSKTFKGLSFLVSGGHTLTLNNLNIDNSSHPELAMVTAGDNNANNRLAFSGENTFTRQGASSENATKEYAVPLPLVQVKADTTLNVGQAGSGVLNLNNPGSPRSQAALIGTQHFSAFGTINIAGGSLNLKGSSESAALIGSGGAYYEVNPNTNPSWLNNYDETPWSAGGTINVKGGTVNLAKVGNGAYGGAFIGAGRGAVKMLDAARSDWAQKNAAVTINVSGGQINATGNHTALGAGSFTTPMQDSEGHIKNAFTQPYPRVNISGGLVQVSPATADTGNSAMNIGCRGVGNWNENFANLDWPKAPGCEVAISGGKVTVGTADSHLDQAGDIAAIGSGPDSANLDVKISGKAQVTAYSNGRGAAIGGGYASGASKVTISDSAQVDALGVVRESPAIGAGGLPPEQIFAGNSRLNEDTIRAAEQNQVVISGNARVNAETARDSAEKYTAVNGAIGSAANRSGRVSLTDQANVTAKVFGRRDGAVIGSAGFIDTYVSDPFQVTISGSPTVQAAVQPVSQQTQKLGYGFGAAIGSGYQTKVPARITLSGSPNLDLIGGQASSGVGLGFQSSGGGSSVTANLDAGAKLQVTSPEGAPRTDGSAQRTYSLADRQNMPLDTSSGKGQVLNLRFADGKADGAGNPQTLGLSTAVAKLTQNKQSVPFSLVTPEGETVLSSALTSTLYNNLALSVPKTGNYYLQSRVTPSLFAYHGDKNAADAFIFPVNGQIYTQDGLLWAPGYSLKYQVAGEGGTLPQAYTTARYLPPNTVIGALPAVTLPSVSGKTCAVDHWELNDASVSEDQLTQTKLSADTVVKAVTKCEDTVTPPDPQPEKTTFTWQLQDAKGQALSGGQFTLTEKDGAAVTVPDSASGTFTANDLDPAKSYVLTQTAAPKGYDLPQQTSHTVTFEKTSQGYQAKVDGKAVSGEAFVITNAKTPLPPQPVSFTWQLRDTDNNLLPGGSFKLVCGSEEVALPAAGSASGTYSVSLDPTKESCTLTQSAAPEGYKLGDVTSYEISFVEKDKPSGTWVAVVAGKETSHVTFTNVALPKPPATTSFAWKLTGSDGKNLNGATFTLNGGDTPLTVISQDAADPGVYSVSNLDPKKTYTLTETTAPSGYAADKASYKLTFVANGDTYKPQINGQDLPAAGLVIKNVKLPTKAEIRWEVVSTADSSQYVPGTTFKVTAFKADGKTLDSAMSFTVSDATAIAGDRDLNPNLGQYRVEVPDGSLKYQVEQLTAGADFAPKTGAQEVTFKLQKDGRYSQNVVGSGLKFENTPVIKTAQFTWKLVDKDSKPLAGGSFSLKDGNETVPVTENKADASFQATLNQAKTYKLQQTAAPEGYDKDTKTYTISYEGGKAQVSVDDTGVDLSEGTLVISNSKQATDPTPDPTEEPTTDPTTPGTDPTDEPTTDPTPDPKPVSGLLTWKVVDSQGKAVAGTSFQVTPLGKDGEPNTAAAFDVTDSVSGPTTFAVPTDQDAATGAYKVQVGDVSLKYQLEQLTTAKGLQLAAPQTLSFSQDGSGKWAQNAATSFVNPVTPEEPPATDPTSKPTDPTTEPQPGHNDGNTTQPSAGQSGGATEAPAGAYMAGGSSAGSSSAAGPAPSSLRVTGANGGTLALISAILALAGAGVLTARKLREDR
ncbi:SpaA isopeptide-forming pilin-related protein [Varibaculum cambriense]|uniref:SpaA isopeptide-forming pilin-related protein n=1 Tax=Varibaculum cambriense TaxID=184870 RepID=UPI002900FF20|nr:SpaA isopeptide-forming pilin-related protein [Varibaculum cambriense]MDU1224614.1 SpaA isopeptide-forming pilin-related protein [Varibaculum cambriense]